MSELKTCPFCGSIAEVKGEGREWFVACTDDEECGAEGHRALVDAYAVQCWNTRATTPTASELAMREALNIALGSLKALGAEKGYAAEAIRAALKLEKDE